MSEYIIETRHLSKRYKKNAPWALEELNLRVPQGALFGFIGPNGAGKTTTLRLLAGLLEPTQGEVWIAGQAVHKDPRAIHTVVGYMPDSFGLYYEMTAWEYLDFFARCHALSPAYRKRVVDELLELVGLSHKRNEDVGHLSRGMQQRLCLAHALVHDPQVLLLDEPASGLDPRARVEMRELLRELSAMGKTIVLSSHILSELAEMCNEIGIIQKGKIVASGPLSALRNAARPSRIVRLHVLSDPETAIAALKAYPPVEDAYALANGTSGQHPGAWLEAHLTGTLGDVADLLAHAVQCGVRLIEYREAGNELEELFLQLTTDETYEEEAA